MINYNGFEKAKKEFIMKRCQQVILDFQKKQKSLEIFEKLFKNLDDNEKELLIMYSDEINNEISDMEQKIYEIGFFDGRKFSESL